MEGKAAAERKWCSMPWTKECSRSPDTRPPIRLTFFNQRRRLGVQTSLTLPTLLKEDLAKSDFANKGYLIGDGKGGPPAQRWVAEKFSRLRLLERDAAHGWAGPRPCGLHRSAPDSLTRYRVMAIAATKQSQFGSGESAFEIEQAHDAANPRCRALANLGDKMTLRACCTTIPSGGRSGCRAAAR